jgi:hypothetical protein
MVLRHKATYNGKLNIEDRPKFVKDLETFKGKPFYIVLRKDISEDLDYLNRYYWACIVDGFSNESGYSKHEAHNVLKDRYGIVEREKVGTKLDVDTLETALRITTNLLQNFASASNIKQIVSENGICLEYTKGYSVMTAKERIAYHNRCREGLFKELNLSLPNEREVEI